MRNWCLLCLITLLAACDSSRIYEEFQDVDTYWLSDQKSSFVFEIEDHSLDYRVIAHVRNDISYPFRNLYLNYTLQTAEDSVMKEELKQLQLFEPKSGEPFGSGIGDQFNNELVLEDQIKFPANGAYRVDLKQFMRVDSLSGIHRVGLRVERAQ